MAIGELCNREVVVVGVDTTIAEAARLMREHHVGDLVVVRTEGGKRVPIGIVTDRDLVVEVVAPQLNEALVSVDEIMGSEIVTVHEDIGMFEAIRYMRDKGVRRLPVVDKQGGLIGILTLDDLIGLLAEELNELARLMERERKKEATNRR